MLGVIENRLVLNFNTQLTIIIIIVVITKFLFNHSCAKNLLFRWLMSNHNMPNFIDFYFSNNALAKSIITTSILFSLSTSLVISCDNCIGLVY